MVFRMSYGGDEKFPASGKVSGGRTRRKCVKEHREGRMPLTKTKFRHPNMKSLAPDLPV
ncbi:hypothetical protein HanXRQr2_Chr11g0510911 [Helianthus annuus]|uniref:Uncharacterized protein n=1 Tax=Helianthus annuus TaxID=4232 RepID=A0A9K3N267_HELAN|nr:hypothetical protein HanXRQr2_Chr11g0510911 [Helianthus annuus]